MPTIIYWLIVASLHSTDIHGYRLFHSKAVIGKESSPKACCGVRGRHLRHGFFVCQYLIEILPTIIYLLIVASTHSTDNHGYSLFHSKAVIGKESAPNVSSHRELS